MLALAQMPSFHSLRHFNLSSLILSLAYCVCTTAGATHIGNYSASDHGENVQRTSAELHGGDFNVFQRRDIGYWAFGNQTQGNILQNFIVNGQPLVPKWFLACDDQCLNAAATHSRCSDVPAANKRGAGERVCRSEEERVLLPQCHPADCFPVPVGSGRHAFGCNVAFLMRHAGSVGSVRVHPFRLYSAHDLLQCHLQAFQEDHNLLGKHIYRVHLHGVVGWSCGIS